MDIVRLGLRTGGRGPTSGGASITIFRPLQRHISTEAEHKPRQKLWTNAERDLLVRLRTDGKTVPRIAEQLGRTIQSIKSQLYLYLVPRQRLSTCRQNRYSPEEDATLLRLKQDSEPFRVISSHFPTRTSCSVRSRLVYLNKSPPVHQTPKSLPFTQAEAAELCRLRDVEHLPWKDVFKKMPSRSPASLMSRYYNEIAITDRPRQRRDNDLTQAEKDEILRLRSEGQTCSAVAATLGRSSVTVWRISRVAK